MTVTPETVGDYSECVDFLFAIGFRYIVVSLHYKGKWTDEHMERLREQYIKLSRWYEQKTLSEEKFYLSPFEKKLAAHIKGDEALCTQCHLGLRQVSIAPDGLIYPCVQFVQDGVSNRTHAIGDVWNGIDVKRQQELYVLSREEHAECLHCAARSRCEHRCACLNWQTTRSISGVSPVLCESERILIPIVDRLGGRLFRRRAPLFIQRHYNARYSFASYIEDHLLSV